MLCDDDPEYRSLVKIVLNDPANNTCGRPLQFFEVPDGRSCVGQLAQTAPDLLLLDLNMPGEDGYSVLGQMRGRLPNTKVVVLSTSRPEDAEDKVLELGALGFVQKPRSIFDLPGLLREKLAAA